MVTRFVQFLRLAAFSNFVFSSVCIKDQGNWPLHLLVRTCFFLVEQLWRALKYGRYHVALLWGDQAFRCFPVEVLWKANNGPWRSRDSCTRDSLYAIWLHLFIYFIHDFYLVLSLFYSKICLTGEVWFFISKIITIVTFSVFRIGYVLFSFSAWQCQRCRQHEHVQYGNANVFKSEKKHREASSASRN